MEKKSDLKKDEVGYAASMNQIRLEEGQLRLKTEEENLRMKKLSNAEALRLYGSLNKVFEKVADSDLGNIINFINSLPDIFNAIDFNSLKREVFPKCESGAMKSI